MRAIPWRNRVIILSLVLCGAPAEATAQTARDPQPAPRAALPPATQRPLVDFLATPRETLKTLYFATVAYDVRPELLDEAIACLDLDPSSGTDPAEAARLAIDLELILRTLCIPVHSVPERTERDGVIALDGDGFRISLARGVDGLWRFDRETVSRIPAMSRAAQARFREAQADRARLVDGYTDPSATMRHFLVDTIARDFYSAARCLDLGALGSLERTEKGPELARQLAFVLQRRGWLFLQEVPNQPVGPPFTWSADRSGRIALERVRLEDGKEAWLFNRKTVRNITAMYEEVKERPADPRYVRLGVALAPAEPGDLALGARRPTGVPADLASPRAMLKGFFRVMEEAETRDAKLAEALQFLDLQGVAPEDRAVLGAKTAAKLDDVLRKVNVELSAIPDDWNAPAQVLGAAQGVRVEIIRQRDGCWRFSQATVTQAPAFFDKITARDKPEPDRAAHFDSARDTMATFLACMRRGDFDGAAACLDLSAFRPGTQEDAGPVLAWKLKYVIDRLGRVYIQEVPEAADGPRYVFYRGELGRIVIARQADGPRKGSWLFTGETVALIERMLRGVIHQAVVAKDGEALAQPEFWRSPGLWVRVRVPGALRATWWQLQTYQWLGLVLAVLVSALVARLLLAQAYRLVALILRHSGSVLTRQFVAARLRPLTWVAAYWLLFQLLALLDLPVRVVDAIEPVKTFGMAGLIAWLGLHVVDLTTAVYMNSELLRPHRSLSDMIVPVTMRSLKGLILLLVAVYVIYQIGEGEYLNRFLTGLGVAGLAASLAAQDALKSFFSTLLLIGERSFKIGDKITVGGSEGTVEQVGFRATRLRTPDGSLLTIPNSTIASAAIENLSTKSFSRFKTTLLVNYDATPERILALRDRVREWLVQHPKVKADKADVSVNRLTEKGVEVTLDLHLAERGGDGEKLLKEEINFAVLRLCDELAAKAPGYHHPLAAGGAGEGLLARRDAA
jgi:MscS family membrane protein